MSHAAIYVCFFKIIDGLGPKINILYAVNHFVPSFSINLDQLVPETKAEVQLKLNWT